MAAVRLMEWTPPSRSGIEVPKWKSCIDHLNREEASEMKITTVGIDLAKNVFQVHGIDAKERVVARKQLRRGQVLAFFKVCHRA